MNEKINDELKDLILRYYTDDESVINIKEDDMMILRDFYCHNISNLKRESVPKCLILFIDEGIYNICNAEVDKDMYTLSKVCGAELLYKVINFKNMQPKK